MEHFEQKLTEDSYSRDIELTFADCDRNQRMRIASMLCQAALFAGHDYDARGLPYTYLRERRQVFLLSRVAMKIHQCPVMGEVLRITTWENGAHGAHLQRVYEFCTRTGKKRVSIRTEWILVDPETRRILRPKAFTEKPITVCPKEIDCPVPAKIAVPTEAENLGDRRVCWSDLDGNGHLFSGNYGDIVWDALPADLQEKCPREFYINYAHEAGLNDVIHLTGSREEGAYRMEGAADHGVCFTALAVFAAENREKTE